MARTGRRLHAVRLPLDGRVVFNVGVTLSCLLSAAGSWLAFGPGVALIHAGTLVVLFTVYANERVNR